MCADAQSAGVRKAAALVGGEGRGIVGGVAKLRRFLEEAGGWEMVGRKALTEDGSAEGAVLGGVLFHQGLKRAGEVAHA